jgi:hypothetical protein
MDKALNF